MCMSQALAHVRDAQREADALMQGQQDSTLAASNGLRVSSADEHTCNRTDLASQAAHDYGISAQSPSGATAHITQEIDSPTHAGDELAEESSDTSSDVLDFRDALPSATLTQTVQLSAAVLRAVEQSMHAVLTELLTQARASRDISRSSLDDSQQDSLDVESWESIRFSFDALVPAVNDLAAGAHVYMSVKHVYPLHLLRQRLLCPHVALKAFCLAAIIAVYLIFFSCKCPSIYNLFTGITAC